MNTGIYYDVPSTVYHASEGVSNSMLNDMHKSPFHCWAMHLNPARPERKETPAMFAGTLAHAAILEPDTFHDRYVVAPDDFSARTSAGKELIKSSEAEGKLLITVDQHETAQEQARAVRYVPELRAILAKGRPESSVFAIDQATGLKVRCRPDWIARNAIGKAVVLDLKTTHDASHDAFGKSVWAYGYHRQAAHYTACLAAIGIEVEQFVFGVVTSSYPFVAAAYVLDEDTLAQGQEEVGELLEQFKNCQAMNHWPAFTSGYQVASLPKWARRELEIEVAYV